MGEGERERERERESERERERGNECSIKKEIMRMSSFEIGAVCMCITERQGE
jgi:hypothetical protein